MHWNPKLEYSTFCILEIALGFLLAIYLANCEKNVEGG